MATDRPNIALELFATSTDMSDGSMDRSGMSGGWRYALGLATGCGLEGPSGPRLNDVKSCAAIMRRESAAKHSSMVLRRELKA
jgi:hypothetical protein